MNFKLIFMLVYYVLLYDVPWFIKSCQQARVLTEMLNEASRVVEVFVFPTIIIGDNVFASQCVFLNVCLLVKHPISRWTDLQLITFLF